MILEGKKGQPSRPVMPLDLAVRPIVDEKYIVPKAIEFIKRQAAAKKPFFVCVGYSEVHPPAMVNPNFAGKSEKRGGSYSDVIGEMDRRHDPLAGIVGASNRVPKDRPIDGIDASAFLLGKSKTTGRDSYMFFGPDGDLMSVKWKIYKMVLRYSEGIDKPIVKPQFPLSYDLSSDPQEKWNITSSEMNNGWMGVPVYRAVAGYLRSVKEYPNIRPGEDFKGYPVK